MTAASSRPARTLPMFRFYLLRFTASIAIDARVPRIVALNVGQAIAIARKSGSVCKFTGKFTGKESPRLLQVLALSAVEFS